ncbi:hypothetical protein [Clavibacter michiganensis]|uniref:Uncharacterized protein n=1 Tax=Clavibacter michiganensis subsp. michiganensis (strain NCPPB 382) TaxID=443906 RepID=A5CLR1_CLAM3|nr:hypothetical protein [Clavibacter michiganensis]MBE3077062.1 hypothetical protein [Clavibacter michiganensis subsp. michiganensis]MDO4019598.1 hypothetical protein [Clavibacter michiganensis]MDO4027153.1 hypothetical protein [Clavibacter michiganensis]MDO4033541.1 hypothetical protein [Clavibacter michiganensis]MDO4039620.1 hypothetical protein [Clavibacter michiganensis]
MTILLPEIQEEVNFLVSTLAPHPWTVAIIVFGPLVYIAALRRSRETANRIGKVINLRNRKP